MFHSDGHLCVMMILYIVTTPLNLGTGYLVKQQQQQHHLKGT